MKRKIQKDPERNIDHKNIKIQPNERSENVESQKMNLLKRFFKMSSVIVEFPCKKKKDLRFPLATKSKREIIILTFPTQILQLKHFLSN